MLRSSLHLWHSSDVCALVELVDSQIWQSSMVEATVLRMWSLGKRGAWRGLDGGCLGVRVIMPRWQPPRRWWHQGNWLRRRLVGCMGNVDEMSTPHIEKRELMQLDARDKSDPFKSQISMFLSISWFQMPIWKLWVSWPDSSRHRPS